MLQIKLFNCKINANYRTGRYDLNYLEDAVNKFCQKSNIDVVDITQLRSEDTNCVIMVRYYKIRKEDR